MSFKRIINLTVILVFTVMAVMITGGCSGIDGDIPEKSEVINKVKETAVNEKFELVSVESYSDERPKKDIYYFKSSERNMTFQAESTLEPCNLDGGTLYYAPVINVKYAEGVHELYLDRINKVLDKIPKDEDGVYFYKSYNDLKNIAHILTEANEIYKEELKYNSAKWLEDNPVTRADIRFEWENEKGQNEWRVILNELIDGSKSYNEIFDLIAFKHTNYIMENNLKDDTIPQEQLSKYHKNYLKDVYVNKVNVSAKGLASDKAEHLVNCTERNYGCYYYYPWKTYIIRINLGLTNEKCAPKLMEHYTEALNIPCEVKYDKGKIRWENGADEWTLEADCDEKNDANTVIFYKNGAKQEIRYLKPADKNAGVGASYLIGLPIDDFAKLFDLKYEIDEKSAIILFVKKY